MNPINKIKTIGIAIGSLGILLAMPITLSLAAPSFIAQVSGDKEKNFTTIVKGKYCHWENETYLMIQDKETWEKVWVSADIQRVSEVRNKDSYSEDRNIPQIDFTQEIVIAAFMGKCPSCAFSIEISKIVDNTVYIIRHVPSYLPDMFCHMRGHPETRHTLAFSSANTCPYHLIRAPISTEQLRFNITTVISNQLYR